MSLALEPLEAANLDLPARDRAALAYRLIVSLDQEPDDDPAEVEAAWEAEIGQRLDAFRRGEVQPIASEDVFARARVLAASADNVAAAAKR